LVFHADRQRFFTNQHLIFRQQPISVSKANDFVQWCVFQGPLSRLSGLTFNVSQGAALFSGTFAIHPEITLNLKIYDVSRKSHVTPWMFSPIDVGAAPAGAFLPISVADGYFSHAME
jgi:hypothetical protein